MHSLKHEIKTCALVFSFALFFCACGSSQSEGTKTGQYEETQESASTQTEDSTQVEEDDVSNDSIVFNDYITVSFYGTEGDGTVSIDIDIDSFYDDISSTEWDKDKVSDYISESEGLSEEELEEEVLSFVRKGANRLFLGLCSSMQWQEPDRIYNGSGITLTFSDTSEIDFLISLLAIDFSYYEETFTVSGLSEPESFVTYTGSDEEGSFKALELENISYRILQDEETGEPCLYLTADIENPNEDRAVSGACIYAHVIMDDGSWLIFKEYLQGLVPAGESMELGCMLNLDERSENAYPDAEHITRVLWYIETRSAEYADSGVYVPGSDDISVNFAVSEEDGSVSGNVRILSSSLKNKGFSENAAVSWADHVLIIRLYVLFLKNGEVAGFQEKELVYTVGVDDSDWGSAAFSMNFPYADDESDNEESEEEEDAAYECIITAIAVSEKYTYEDDGEAYGGSYNNTDFVFE